MMKQPTIVPHMERWKITFMFPPHPTPLLGVGAAFG
jgi:hypothetical protein